MQEEGERILLEDNFYRQLNVATTASAEEITNAFSMFCDIFNPEKHSGNPNMQVWAEQIFNRVKRGYEVLSNPNRRAIYDAMMDDQDMDLDRKVKLRAVRNRDAGSDSDEGYSGKLPRWRSSLLFKGPAKVPAQAVPGPAASSVQGPSSEGPAEALEHRPAVNKYSRKRPRVNSTEADSTSENMDVE